MSRYETEEEQIEAFKNWWNKNGTQLLSGLLVIVIAVSGWRYWTNSQYVASANASATYEVLQMNIQKGSFGEVSREALKLIQEQPESPYAAAAALLHAKYNYDKADFDDAAQHLNWVVENSTDTAMKITAHLRLARMHAENQAFDQAGQQLSALAAMNLTAAAKGNYDYVRGVVAIQQQDNETAYQAFQAVIDNAQAEKNLLGLAQIQLDDLAK